MRTAMVVPSNRPSEIQKFLEAWQPYPWDETIVTADFPEPMSEVAALGATCLSWQEIEGFGTDGWIFSRRDSAIRCLGFLMAARRGADVILTLDDDCRPIGDPGVFMRGHLRNLFHTPCWASSIPGVSLRGMPYHLEQDGTDVGTMVSMGLWRGVADLDAVHQLLGSPGHRDFEPPSGVRVMSPEQFFPFCGMNFAFRREILPAIYFPPMGQGWPYCRFDDIWGGLLLQCVLARTGHAITVGDPCVQHERASDPFKNLIREAPGIEANEMVWRVLWPAMSGNSPDVPTATLEVAGFLRRAAVASTLGEYLERWADAIALWVPLCGSNQAASPTS